MNQHFLPKLGLGAGNRTMLGILILQSYKLGIAIYQGPQRFILKIREIMANSSFKLTCGT